MNRTFLRNLLITSKLFITAEAYAAAMMECFPLLDQKNPVPGAFFFLSDPPTYKDQVDKAVAKLKREIACTAELKSVSLTNDFSSEELPEGSIAYHRIWGTITSNSSWYFSSKQFERDLIAAESNPSISVHFLHINSGGGEAWYLDRLSETMHSLKKPVEVLVEQYCASAGYYIACHSAIGIHALTKNDQIGCIGTMISFYDFSAYYEKLGIKLIQEKSSLSPLKNKKFEDLRAGHPEQYIKEVLDPLTVQFLNEVKSSRPKLANLSEDDPVFQGETFDAQHSIDKGLIDSVMTLPEAIAHANSRGQEYLDSISLRNKINQYV